MADLKPVYKKINGDWVKQTAYERQNGEWMLISEAEQEPSGEPLGYLYGETWEGPYDWMRTPIYGALPSAKEWDRSEYPYVVMYFASTFTHILFASKEPWYGTGEPYLYTDHKGVTTQFGETIKNESSGLWFIDEYTGDIWPNGYQKHIWVLLSEEELEADREYLVCNELGQNKDTDGDGRYDYGAQGVINWSNHDIISADGETVLVAASEPVPVYE